MQSLIYQRYTPTPDEQCYFCAFPLNSKPSLAHPKLPGNPTLVHAFHESCLHDWAMEKTATKANHLICPECRQEIDFSPFFQFNHRVLRKNIMGAFVLGSTLSFASLLDVREGKKFNPRILKIAYMSIYSQYSLQLFLDHEGERRSLSQVFQETALLTGALFGIHGLRLNRKTNFFVTAAVITACQTELRGFIPELIITFVGSYWGSLSAKTLLTHFTQIK